MASATTTASRRAARPPRSRRARRGIRWDRVGRVALLVVLAIVLLLYISPVRSWIAQSQTADRERAALQDLERENAELKRRAEALSSPDAVEREARRIGMVRRGERAVVVQGLPSP